MGIHRASIDKNTSSSRIYKKNTGKHLGLSSSFLKDWGIKGGFGKSSGYIDDILQERSSRRYK